MTTVATVRSNQIAELRYQLETMAPQFKAVLPAHIPVDRFVRVVITALQNNPSLIECERRSLFNAAMKAAEDGLMPDNREGAMVHFRDKRRGLVAQWMPMIAGLRKKVRQSGEIATWEAHVVHQNDRFQFRLGDDPAIEHVPVLTNPGPAIAAYSIAKLKTGELSREIMSIEQIDEVRRRSRAGDSGPWNTDFEEMCRKTVARRHSKVLPMSTDVELTLERDEELFEQRKEEREDAATTMAARPDLAARMKTLAQMPSSSEPLDAPADDFDPDTGELKPMPAAGAATTDPNVVDPTTHDDEADAPAPAPDDDPTGDGPPEPPPDPREEPSYDEPRDRIDRLLEGKPPDWQSGFKAARSGQKDCLNSDISRAPGRLRTWWAGYNAYLDRRATIDDHGRLR